MVAIRPIRLERAGGARPTPPTPLARRALAPRRALPPPRAARRACGCGSAGRHIDSVQLEAARRIKFEIDSVQLELDLRDRLARVEVLRACFAAVHDRVAPVELEGII